jgi:meso-butanediol dehydrogenase/(S,S)-butanediol dehydrogenase/diacetyl reductase
MRLENKVALITGAGSGIGRATAELFAKEGARVAVADYNSETGQSTVRSIKDNGGQAVFVHTDVSKAADAEHMVKAAIDAYGRLDILHNNAGIFTKPTPAHELSEEDWDRVFNINIRGVWLGCKYAIPELIKAGGGAIVNTASMAGIRARPYTSAYCASKGAVVMLTKTLAIELAPYNIRVNCICPGAVNTPLIQGLGITQEQAAGQVLRDQPIARYGRPDEIAHAVLYLASDTESSYVTGLALQIDGGQWAGVTAGLRR